MAVLIVCAGLAGMQVNTTSIPLGEYLQAYDPDYANGIGRADWTPDKAQAKRFPDFPAALSEWKRESKVRPLRADGRPNRPLSAFSITFETVDP